MILIQNIYISITVMCQKCIHFEIDVLLQDSTKLRVVTSYSYTWEQ